MILQKGQIVVLANGSYWSVGDEYIYDLSTLDNCYKCGMEISEFDSDLRHIITNNFDIVKVYDMTCVLDRE